MTDYYALYDAAVDAITAVLPNALVGGPATTSRRRSARSCNTARARARG